MEKLKYDVIILEDDLEHIEQLKQSARKYPFFNIIFITDKTSEAYKIIVSKRPDFLIVDLHVTEGDGDLLIEQIRREFKHADYYPFITAVSSRLLEPITKRILSNLVNDMQTKNSFYNSDKVFTAFLSKKSREIQSQHLYPNIYTKTPTKELIRGELEKYTLSKASKKRLIIVLEIFNCAMEQPIKLNSLEKTCRNIASIHHTSQNTIKGHFSDFVTDIFKDTDEATLQNIFEDYNNEVPSPSHFFNEFLYKIREYAEM